MIEKSVLSYRILTLQQDAFYDHADHITLFNPVQVYERVPMTDRRARKPSDRVAFRLSRAEELFTQIGS